MRFISGVPYWLGFAAHVALSIFALVVDWLFTPDLDIPLDVQIGMAALTIISLGCRAAAAIPGRWLMGLGAFISLGGALWLDLYCLKWLV